MRPDKKFISPRVGLHLFAQVA